MNNAGSPTYCEGDDYGLYQIYGKHILCGPDTLLYIGEATEQTFFDRFKQHRSEWLDGEQDIQIYLGRIYDPEKHSKIDNWGSWKAEVEIAERILIYKYSPHYNSVGIGELPEPPKDIRLIHNGERHRLEQEDNLLKGIPGTVHLIIKALKRSHLILRTI